MIRKGLMDEIDGKRQLDLESVLGEALTERTA